MAEEIKRRFGVDLVRFSNSGTEATMDAIRVARGFTGREKVVKFDMLHAVPHMASPDFLAQSPLANEAGWTDVDKHTLQHVRYANVFGLGDAGSTPNAKTGAAIRKQYPVVAENLLAIDSFTTTHHSIQKKEYGRIYKCRQRLANSWRQRFCAGIHRVAHPVRRPHPQHLRGRGRDPGAGDRAAPSGLTSL